MSHSYEILLTHSSGDVPVMRGYLGHLEDKRSRLRGCARFTLEMIELIDHRGASPGAGVLTCKSEPVATRAKVMV
jgi:hypothetical protein